MLDNFLESIDAPFSDDEDSFPVASMKPEVALIHSKCSVSTVVVAVAPSSAAISGLVDPVHPVAHISVASKQIGTAFVTDSVGYVSIDANMSFEIASIFVNYNRVIVLHSQQGPSDNILCLSTGVLPAKELDSPVTGLPARIMTRCIIDGVECTILVNQHRSIRVELVGLFDMHASLSACLNCKPNTESVKTAFKRLVPINTKVPLYT